MKTGDHVLAVSVFAVRHDGITWKKVMKDITDLEGETYTVGLASWRYKVVNCEEWNSVTRGYYIIKELCH